jgi:lipopolysaccharide transport system ATP-binding protein
MEPIINIQGLGKKYRIGNAQPYLSFRDAITNSFNNPFSKKDRKEFWALNDINLQIAPGERVGIIGNNGAGKSTLLKVLSRITPPTKGSVTIHGKVASLLEVGTGFHSELTGRENIYLNGSILGLKKKEIDKRLEAIIDFSGVERFIDTPLKHYSSGMQLRLAFSVAAHLEPDILLIDEVLAVGDAEFQKKCIGKMEEISKKSGRIILFVSHNMAAVKQLCTHGVLLENGHCVFKGDIKEAVSKYSSNFLGKVSRIHIGKFSLEQHPNKVRKDEGLKNATLFIDDQPSEVFTPGSTLTIELEYFLKTKLTDPEIGIVIKDSDHTPLIGLNNKHIGSKLELQTETNGKAYITIPELNLFAPGKYLVDLYLGDQYHFYECLYDAFQFQVPYYDVYQTGVELRPEWNRIFVKNIQISA